MRNNLQTCEMHEVGEFVGAWGESSLVAFMQWIEGPWQVYSPSPGRVRDDLASRVLYRPHTPI